MTFSILSRKASGDRGGGGTGNVFGIFIEALSLVHDGRLAVPLILYFVLRIVIISLYLASVSEPFSSFWALFVRGLSGEALNHYPAHLILMPVILSRIDIILDIFASVMFQGATIALIAAARRRRPVSLAAGFSEAAVRYRHMIAVMFIVAIALSVCLNLPRLFTAGIGGAFRLGITGLALLLGLIVQAVFLYAIPLVVLERRSAPQAISASARLMSRTAITTFLIVAAPFILTAPTLLLGFRAEMIAYRISPNFLLINQVAGEIMYLIATYLMIGGATIVLLRTLRADTAAAHTNKTMEAAHEAAERTGTSQPGRIGT